MVLNIIERYCKTGRHEQQLPQQQSLNVYYANPQLATRNMSSIPWIPHCWIGDIRATFVFNGVCNSVLRCDPGARKRCDVLEMMVSTQGYGSSQGCINFIN
jgi:hypothetical protein